MKWRIILVLVTLPALRLVAGLPPEFEALKADAEKLFAEGSFAKAGEIYRRLTPTNLPPAEQRWGQFRQADCQWRAETSTQNADTTITSWMPFPTFCVQSS